MYDLFKLKSPIGRSYNTDPDDVRKTKKALSGLGYYEEPDFGITPYPDASMMDGLENFQRDFGLRLDGVMKPGGETAQMLGSANHINAQNLQSLGRNGDSILAHITPGEARLLKRKCRAGTINPKTGLLEFSKESNKEGEYIWRTEGDSKVRSSHAERNGKTFSWDNPPEGGHPGEAENCRCTAEDIVGKKDCEKIRWEADSAYRRHDALQKIILATEGQIINSKKIIKNLGAELENIRFEIATLLLPSRRKSRATADVVTSMGIAELQKRAEDIEREIEIEEQMLIDAEEKLERLKGEREDHRLNAEELVRQYKECTGEQ